MAEAKQNTNTNNRSRQETKVTLQPGLSPTVKRNEFSTLTESSKFKSTSNVKKGSK